jgi:hypothetical protein
VHGSSEEVQNKQHRAKAVKPLIAAHQTNQTGQLSMGCKRCGDIHPVDKRPEIICFKCHKKCHTNRNCKVRKAAEVKKTVTWKDQKRKKPNASNAVVLDDEDAENIQDAEYDEDNYETDSVISEQSLHLNNVILNGDEQYTHTAILGFRR